MSAERPPLPAPTALVRRLSDALRPGPALQQCRAYGHVVYFPRVACPECWSPSLEWTPISGEGVVVSFTAIHRSLHAAFADAPRVLCAVQLREGPVVLGLLDSGDGEAGASIGLNVRAVSCDIGDDTFVFRFKRL